ncbi:MAG: hypothetical protein KKD32_03655 [Proteobacteria bacterium]|nr:hypothetical protein [Pseudomonadota bacterium]MBU1586256.1 hypothetical protein [Pseudomonadota bacterium]MBU2453152.1 hypothetical protein [Pseudomonadota bacterium]MBU2630817.1 hypothetical protein [Pseudomonadota bacterium]
MANKIKKMQQRYGNKKLAIKEMFSDRQEAYEAGHSHYYTGNPCKRNHIAPRLVSSSACVECLKYFYRRKKNPNSVEKIGSSIELDSHIENVCSSYHCPNCNRLLIIGIIKRLYIACPDCHVWLNYDSKNKSFIESFPNPGLKYGGSIAKKRFLKKEYYGRDRLTIDQMFSTQQEAQKAGHSHFFTGKPCRNRHVAPRTTRGECNQCVRDVF